MSNNCDIPLFATPTLVTADLKAQKGFLSSAGLTNRLSLKMLNSVEHSRNRVNTELEDESPNSVETMFQSAMTEATASDTVGIEDIVLTSQQCEEMSRNDSSAHSN